MKKILMPIIPLLIISCNSKDNGEYLEERDLTYQVMISNNNRHNEYLTENIRQLLASPDNIASVQYDSLTVNYISYLEQLETEITRNSTSILFKDGDYSDKGKEFISKSKTYKANIDSLAKDYPNFSKRANLALNVNDVAQPKKIEQITNNESGKGKSNTVYFRYLDFHFNGLSNIQALAFINYRKRNVLEFENEFLLLSNKQIK